jgi:hypothetical protein
MTDLVPGGRPSGWTAGREEAMLGAAGDPSPLTAEQAGRLVRTLRGMDLQQQQTDERGQREVVWYYWRGQVEDALGLDCGALDMTSYVDALVREIKRECGPVRRAC